MTTINFTGTSLGNQLTSVLMADDLLPGDSISYQTAKTIFAYHPLGKKMAEKPIALAMTKARNITIPRGPEERCREVFLEKWKELSVDAHIKNMHTLKRVYGIASIAMIQENVTTDKPVNFLTLWKSTISFNVLDPLNTAGSLVGDLNPNSAGFLKTSSIAVSGQAYHRSRTVAAMNGPPIYLEYSNSAFGYVGRSSYQAGLYLLKSFLETMITDDMVARKAGVLIAMLKGAGSIVDNIMSKMAGLKRAILKEARTNNVINIDLTEKIETLNMQNVNGAMSESRKNILENLAASDDMPAQLLNSETFAEGFGEGSEDAKAVAHYIDDVRRDMQETYEYFDQIVQYMAWTPEFYETIQAEYPDDYGKMSYQQAFYRWKNSFSAEWPSLLTEPASEAAKVDDIKLKALISTVAAILPSVGPINKAKTLRWFADNLNENKQLFTSPLVLDEDELENWEPPVPAALGAPKEDEEDEKPERLAADSQGVVKLLGRRQ